MSNNSSSSDALWIPNLKLEDPGPIATKQCSVCRAELTDDNWGKGNQKARRNRCAHCENQRNRNWLNKLTTAKYLHNLAKKRSKRKGREFTITVEDVEAVMTDTCPLLNIPIKRYPITGVGGYRAQDDAISLDRLNSSKGYIPGNIIVCSWRANNLMSNSTPNELLLLATNFHRILNETTHPTD